MLLSNWELDEKICFEEDEIKMKKVWKKMRRSESNSDSLSKIEHHWENLKKPRQDWAKQSS